MSEQEESMALVPSDEGDTGPPMETLPCYEGVPVEVADQCETVYAVSRAVRLEALRRVRDLLAPYGKFKQWCHDHEENYGSVTYALSRAYGTVSQRPVKSGLTGGLLEEPHTEAQAIIEMQAARLRALEAQVAAYKSRTAEELRAEAQRLEEEPDAVYAGIARITAALAHDDPALAQAVEEERITLAQGIVTLLVRNAVAWRAVRDSCVPELFRAMMWVTNWLGLREVSGTPPSDADLARITAVVEWAVGVVEAEHITESIGADGVVTHGFAARVLREALQVPPLSLVAES